MLVVIPARAGSKRVDNKALRPLAGQSLVQRAILRAQAAGYAPVVATESDAIAEEARRFDAAVWMRDPATAKDASPDWLWAKLLPAQFPDERVFGILRITSPFLAASHLDRMAEELANLGASSIRCVSPVTQHPGKMWLREASGLGVPIMDAGEAIPYHSRPTQTLPAVFAQTAGAEVTTARTLATSFAGDRVALYVVEGDEALDINTPEDWKRAEAICAKRR